MQARISLGTVDCEQLYKLTQYANSQDFNRGILDEARFTAGEVRRERERG